MFPAVITGASCPDVIRNVKRRRKQGRRRFMAGGFPCKFLVIWFNEKKENGRKEVLPFSG